MLTSFQFPAYRWLWFSNLAGSSGRWAMVLVLSAQLLQLTHSSFWVGLGLFLTQGPVVLAAPYSGAMADRFDRRLLNVISAAAAAATTRRLRPPDLDRPRLPTRAARAGPRVRAVVRLPDDSAGDPGAELGAPPEPTQRRLDVSRSPLWAPSSWVRRWPPLCWSPAARPAPGASAPSSTGSPLCCPSMSASRAAVSRPARGAAASATHSPTCARDRWPGLRSSPSLSTAR
jgi:hypothetical protein